MKQRSLPPYTAHEARKLQSSTLMLLVVRYDVIPLLPGRPGGPRKPPPPPAGPLGPLGPGDPGPPTGPADPRSPRGPIAPVAPVTPGGPGGPEHTPVTRQPTAIYISHKIQLEFTLWRQLLPDGYRYYTASCARPD